MEQNEIIQLIRDLNSLKTGILQLNDYLLLNMESDAYQKMSVFLVNKIKEINNIIEKMNKMGNLISEYEMTANLML